jgi:hypothetical protein
MASIRRRRRLEPRTPVRWPARTGYFVTGGPRTRKYSQIRLRIWLKNRVQENLILATSLKAGSRVSYSTRTQERPPLKGPNCTSRGARCTTSLPNLDARTPFCVECGNPGIQPPRQHAHPIRNGHKGRKNISTQFCALLLAAISTLG